jgi:hypothetical protein
MRTVEASLCAARLAVWSDEGLAAGTPSWTAASARGMRRSPSTRLSRPQPRR